MSELLIDIGNTALKWAWANDPAAPATLVHAGVGDLRPTLRQAWAGLRPARVFGCSVAADLAMHAVDDALTPSPVVWLRAQARFAGEFSLINAYRDPLALGTDRWHAALGAASLHPGEALLVVHVGTATTVDSIVPRAHGELLFAGGRIAPGPVLMRDSLARGTARLPQARGQRTDFPDNTMDAISTGVIDAQVGLVERAADAMRGAGHEPRLMLAGGSAQEIAPYLMPEFERAEVAHNLVLRGLALRAQHDFR